MGKKILLLLAVAIVVMVMVPATALAAGLVNEYGMHYAGQQACVDCHAFFGGTTTNTVHSRFVKQGLVPTPPAAWTAFTAAGTPPVVAGTPPALFNSGGSYNIDQPWLTFGDFAGGSATEYAFWRGSANPNVLPWNLVEGLAAEPNAAMPFPIDEGDYAVGQESPATGLYDVQYSCQRCHQLGSTVPTTAAGQAVPNPAATIAATATTPRQWARPDTKSVADFIADPTVSYPGMSIQCENCHGTGVAATPAEGAHTNTGVKVSTTLDVLGQSQVCGQCHGSYTNVAGTLGIYGYTTNQPMRNFVDINGLSGGASYTYIPTELEFMAAPTKYFMFPNGDNAKGSHYYYNEWSATAHSWRQALAKDDPNALAYQARSDTSSHFPFATAAPGCLKCHTGEGYLQSKGDPLGANVTLDATDTGKMGQECITCHAAHPSGPNAPDVIREPDKAGARSATGLTVDNASICEDCHNWQMEVLGTTPTYKPLADITAHLISHPQREMYHGRSVMVDVPDTAQAMPGVKCEDCHMPKTNKAANRFSHGMKIMLPEDADNWNAAANAVAPGTYLGEDSCSKCHATESRDALQADINTWQGDATTLADNAKAAILAVTGAATPPAEYSLTDSTKPGYILIGRATWNYKAWEADSSDGAHNPAYIQAGLTKAVQEAKSVGGSFAQLFASKSVVPTGTGFVTGKVVNGDGSGAAAASLALWANGADTGMKTTADAQGNFAFMVNPTGTATTYKVVWLRSGDPATDLASASLKVDVVKQASKTTLASSAKTILLGKTVKLSGKVSPATTGNAKIQYRRTTSGTWKTAVNTFALNASSGYSKTYRPSAKGTWYFRTLYAGNTTVASSISPTVKVTVK